VKKVLVTGSGTGFGHEVAMRLAEKGFEVIAAVEIWAQVQTLKRQAAGRGVSLQVEKLDVTDAGDRKKALRWDVEILVNNAGVGEGGSTPRHSGRQYPPTVRGERYRPTAIDPGDRQADGRAT
jgi:NADP-dependent 3-hydroxy acid dehydrogenase YdfG